MSVPVRSFASIWNPPQQVQCSVHSVPVTIWSDYAIWCDTHGSFIPPELTNVMSQDDE